MIFQFAIFFVVLYQVYGKFNFVVHDELKEKFFTEYCIELNRLTNFELTEWTTTTKEILNTADENINLVPNEKSILQEVQELVQYNDLKYHYELLKEEGPPNSKVFTVALYLGDEKYYGTGTSLKKAQREAANLAMKQTAYDHPPIKESLTYLTPTVKLNNIAAKLAYSVQYFLIQGNKEKDITNIAIDERNSVSYFQKLNDSITNSTSFKIPQTDESTRGPFNVRVKVGSHTFVGFGYTIQLARHDAAINAIEGLKNIALNDNPCLVEGKENSCRAARDKLKSPISLVYEAAQKRNMEAIFEIVEEYGKPHKKVFVTELHIGNISTRGEGSSKKDSKRDAAEEMLKRIHELPNITDESLIVSGLKTKNKKKKNKNKLIKTNVAKVELFINDLYESFVGKNDKFDKNKLNSQHNDATNVDDVDDHDENSNIKKLKNFDALRQSKTAFEALLQLSNKLQFDVQLNQMKNDIVNLSLIQLGLKPIYICYGEDVSQKLSKEKAALAGLKFLHKNGYSDFTKVLYPEIEKYILMEKSKARLHQVKNIDKDEL